MPAVPFTDKTLKSLRPPAEGRLTYSDATFPAFMLRITAKGTKTFCYRYRVNGAGYQRVTLGSYPAVSLAEARNQAKQLEAQVLRGRNPALALKKERQVPTFAEFFEYYLKCYATQQKESWREDARALRKDALPLLGPRRLTEIERRDIAEVLRGPRERGAASMASHLLTILKTVFWWAENEGLIEKSPCSGMRNQRRKKKEKRPLTLEEIREVWWALEQEHASVRGILRLLILTGQRVGEVVQMRWSQIENGNLWCIPKGVRKNRGNAPEDHLVPLSRAARAVLDELRGGHASWVFPSERKHCMVNVDHVGQVADRLWQQLRMEPWTTHDTRCTLTTHLAKLRVSAHLRHLILGHLDTTMAGIHYDAHDYLEEKREALELWGARVMEVVGEEARARMH